MSHEWGEPTNPATRHCSLAYVAAELGISPDGAGVIEKRALRKLRRELDRRGLAFEDLVGDGAGDHPMVGVEKELGA